jgi:hypothetical protein
MSHVPRHKICKEYSMLIQNYIRELNKCSQKGKSMPALVNNNMVNHEIWHACSTIRIGTFLIQELETKTHAVRIRLKLHENFQ